MRSVIARVPIEIDKEIRNVQKTWKCSYPQAFRIWKEHQKGRLKWDF